MNTILRIPDDNIFVPQMGVQRYWFPHTVHNGLFICLSDFFWLFLGLTAENYIVATQSKIISESAFLSSHAQNENILGIMGGQNQVKVTKMY